MTEIKDPIAFELFKNAIFSIADEMALTIVRTTYSGVLRDNMDFSTALTDGDGRLVAQGLTIPGHLGSIPTAIGTILERYGAEMGDGDIYAMNDPYDGGMHLPDIYIVKPIYVNGERLAFGVSICHHTDVGGRVAGSNASDSTEIYQEGLRIPALKLYERGKPNDTLFALIERNVRGAGHRVWRSARPNWRPATSPRSSSSRSSRALRPRAGPRTDGRNHRLRRAPHPCRAGRTSRRHRQPSRIGLTTTASMSASRSACSSP